MALVYLLLGGNLGNREKTLERAKAKIGSEVGIINQESGIYETEPWGFKAEQFFLNQLLQITTDLAPEAVLDSVLKIENDLGRQRNTEQMSSRIIDIDILFYDDLVLKDDHLTIPHPRLHLRRFALAPLTEIVPNLVHPVYGKSMKQLMLECKDEQEANLLVN